MDKKGQKNKEVFKMKQLIFLVAFIFSTFTTAYAENTVSSERKRGVYIAPKLLIGSQHSDIGLINSDDKYYDKVDFGDAAISFGLAVGYDITKNIRTELEYLYFTEQELSYSESLFGSTFSITAKNSISTLLINAYYDFNNTSKMTPYLGAGIGIASNKVSVSYSIDTFSDSIKTDSSLTFAGNITAGISLAMTDSFSLDMSGRYILLGKGKTKSFDLFDDGDYIGHTSNVSFTVFAIGARYTF